MKHFSDMHTRAICMHGAMLLAVTLCIPGDAVAAGSIESQVQQQFAARSAQSMSIELQGELLGGEMARIKGQLATAGKAASEDRAMCGEMVCEGSELASRALAKYLQSLQAVLSSTQTLRKQMHRMSGYMVDTEGLLLDSKGGLNDQEMAVAVSDGLIDFNQIITGNIGVLSKRLNRALGDFTVSAANTAGRTALGEGGKVELRKLIAASLSQVLQEDINTVFSKGVKDSTLASNVSNEVLNQAIDTLTNQAYNAYLAHPGGQVELSPASIGLGVLRAGLEGIAKEKLRQRQERLSALKRQLSENERNRMLWILQWRLSQRLYIHLQKAQKQAESLLTEFNGLASTCHIKSLRLQECRAEAGTELQTVSDKHRARIEAATSKLKKIRAEYDTKMKGLDTLRAKIAANEKQAEAWNRKYAQARKEGASAADSYRESRDLARQAVEDDRLALSSHETAIDSEYGWPLDQARLAVQQAIEQGQMAMEFAQNDALRKVRACLEIKSSAGGKQEASAATAGQDESVLDELLAYAVKTQDDALNALQAVRIRYAQDGCDKPSKRTAEEAPAKEMPTIADGAPIDPHIAGLYSSGTLLVMVSVEGVHIRGEVLKVCEAGQRIQFSNYTPGDLLFEGAGQSDRSIKGKLQKKRVPRFKVMPGMQPLECMWNKPRAEWVKASFYLVPKNRFSIQARYKLPLSMNECGRVSPEVDEQLLFTDREKDASAMEAMFDLGCAQLEESVRRNPPQTIQMGRVPDMPITPAPLPPPMEPMAPEPIHPLPPPE